MDINFKDDVDNEAFKATSSTAHKLLNKLLTEESISTETIMSFESQLGVNSIPIRIKNSVTPALSKHGYNELVAHMRSLVQRRSSATMVDVLTRLYADCTALSQLDINKIIERLYSDLDILSKLYVPKSIRTGTVIGETVASNLRLSAVTDGTVGAITFNNVKVNTLRYLSRHSASVPYGSIRILIQVLSDGYIEYDESKVSTLSYNGTIEDFITDTINDLRKLTTFNLVEGCTYIANSIDSYAISEPYTNTMVNDIIEEYTYILKHDTFIKNNLF